MTYYSKRPTREKRDLYNFMERHKKKEESGEYIVVGEKIGRYIEEREFGLHKIEADGRHGLIFGVTNKRGTPIASGFVRKKKVTHWRIE